MRFLLILAFIVPLLTTTAFAQKTQKAPNFSLQSSDGKSVDLSKLKGKVVVVNFWATWCPPCRAEIPAFISVYQKYRAKGLEIVGISLDEKGWNVVRPFVEKNKISYPVVLGNNTVAQDYGEIRSIPTTFIVDRKGNIVDTHVGGMDAASFEAMVKRHL
jgi:thiol-disulfide isomerase/thioredoxin